MATEKIAIIGGAGELGFGLALRWAQAGADVVIGSRDCGKILGWQVSHLLCTRS